MKNILKYMSGCLAIFTLISCSQNNFPDGTYQQSKITADGDLSDWGLPLHFESKLGIMQYAVTNDDTNIYISLYTTDNAEQLKILKSGVDIYIDPTGHQNKKMVISFPMKASYNTSTESNSTNTANMSKYDLIKLKDELIMEANIFNVTGFKEIDNRLYDIKDTSNIRVALKMDLLGKMGYEVIVPIRNVLGSAMKEKVANHKMSVGIVVKALEHPISGEGQRHFGLMNGMGMMTGGGIRHSGMGGGYSHNQSNSNSDNSTPERAAFYKQDDNWYMFKLAYKKN